LTEVQRIVNFCLKSKPHLDKESIAADIWLELWEKDSPLSFIAVKHRCIDAVRHDALLTIQQIEQCTEDDFKFQISLPVDEYPQRMQDLSDIVNALMRRARLDNTSREILYLRFYADLELSEIAARMKTSESTVARLIKAALFTLKKKGKDLVE